jgi:hypothetical protein
MLLGFDVLGLDVLGLDVLGKDSEQAAENLKSQIQ